MDDCYRPAPSYPDDANIAADVMAALAALTPEAKLVQVERAIAKAETSQRYKIGDREVNRGDLRWLYPERKRLEAQVARRRRGGVRFSRIVPL